MITSSSNENIKTIRKLKNRKYRDETGLFFIEGSRIVIEALQQRAEIKEILFTSEYKNSMIGQQVLKQANESSVRVTEVSNEIFKTISQKENPQGVGAVLVQKWFLQNELPKKLSGIWISLFEVADPGNLGTIIRTCDATGVEGIILVGNCTDPYDPTALRASMGGVFSKKLVKISEEDFASWVEMNKINMIGTADSAKTDLRSCHFPSNMILAMGSEREGLPEKIAGICQKIISIPMKGSCDSLNLAVATGIVLYEILYQQQTVMIKGK